MRGLSRSTPSGSGGASLTGFLGSVLPAGPQAGLKEEGSEVISAILAAFLSLLGAGLAWQKVFRRPGGAESEIRAWLDKTLGAFWLSGWGFDWLYDRLFVRSFVWIARVNRGDFVDAIYAAIAWLSRRAHALLSATQDGKVRRYAAAIAGGAIILIALAVCAWR